MSLLGALGRLLGRITCGIRTGVAWVVRGVAGATHRVIVIIARARRLLANRWAEDYAFRRTVLAAQAAVIATLLPHPAVAAALAAVVADRPRMGHRPQFDDDEDDWPRRESRPWRDTSTGPLWNGYI